MKTAIMKWTLGSALIATVLAGAYRVIQINQVALGGAGKGGAAGFYGH